MPVSEKTTENSERLGGQVLPGIEPGTSRLPALSAEPLGLPGGATVSGVAFLPQN